MAWPAWAITHLHGLFFSGAVNVPHGANLLSNTSGTLVGVVLAPVTWLFGPVTATNVALTLAPALSAWGCFAAVRPLVTWKPGAIPAGLVYGYSAAIVTSLALGHVSVTLLVIPPLLFTTLHEIVIRQEHSVRRDGARAGRTARRAIPDLARGAGDVPVAGRRRHGGRHGGRLAPSAGAGRARAAGARARGGSDHGAARLPGLVRRCRAAGGDRAALPAGAGPGGAALGPPLARPVRGVRERVRPLRGLPGPHRPSDRLRGRRRGAGRAGGRGGGPEAPPHMASRLHDGRHAVARARRVPRARARLARSPVAALERALAAARLQGDPAGPVGAAHHPLHRLPARGRPRRAVRRAPTADLVGRAPSRARSLRRLPQWWPWWRSCRSS